MKTGPFISLWYAHRIALVVAIVLLGGACAVDSAGVDDLTDDPLGASRSCGNKACSAKESCSTCPEDCGVCPVLELCGDSVCQASESCSSCPEDCDPCVPPAPSCGDSVCTADEDCATCAEDCGVCPPPPPPPTYGTTYYVRTDGGDASQCTGRSDAAYPGSGSNLACAWKHPFIALPPSGTKRILGSDTLIIGSGSYLMGTGGYMQPIPSGSSATTPTRILGKTCSAPPKLVGTNGTHRVLNLDGSSNVEVGCLEVTDQSDCVFGHSVASVACTTSDVWARGGLYAFGSSNVWLHDLNIHGMGARGIQAGGLRDWTIERVKLNTNGTAGWNGTSDAGSSNSGTIIMRDIEIGWNGCGERWQTGQPWACWAQQTGGYGDGLGTTDTGGTWLIEDAYIHHNTSDGLDLRYMDGADTTHVTLRRIHSVANAGNQVKVKGSMVIENSVLVGHCSFFEGQYFMVSGDLCRAYGSTLLLILTGNDVAVVRHNTVAGEGDAQIAYGEGDPTDKLYIQNNTVVGFPYHFAPSSFTWFSGGGAPAAKSFSGNLAWNVRTCPGSGTTCGQNPKLTNMTLNSFDAAPLAGSPVIDSAPSIAAVVDDFLGRPRPVGAAPDIGAYEVQLP